MARWNDAWFGGESMPPNSFPKDLIPTAQLVAESWLFDAQFRCVLEEWVSRPEADEMMGGLLWSGFCLRGPARKRIAPKPVLVRLLYTEPYPITQAEVSRRMHEFYRRAVREWILALQQHGSALIVAP